MSRYGSGVLRVLALLVFAAESSADLRAEPAPPEGWVVYPTPKKWACEWDRARSSKYKWVVRSDGDRFVSTPIVDGEISPPEATPAPTFDTRSVEEMTGPPCHDCVLRVDEGWLVGFNFGEYGGHLWWTDSKGDNAYPVADTVKTCGGTPIPPNSRLYEYFITNIVSLKSSGEQYIAASGQAFDDPGYGEISRVEKRDGKWQTCRLHDLGGRPYVMIPEEANWLVLTQGGLVRFDARGAMQRFGRPSLLDGWLDPNSMVKMRDGTIYVGMRHFVARLLLARGTYRDQLLLPANRPPFEYDEFLDGEDGMLRKGCEKLKRGVSGAEREQGRRARLPGAAGP